MTRWRNGLLVGEAVEIAARAAELPPEGRVPVTGPAMPMIRIGIDLQRVDDISADDLDPAVDLGAIELSGARRLRCSRSGRSGVPPAEGDGAGAASPLVVGVAGGSASGKSAVVEAVVEKLGADTVAVVPHDAYYRDLSHLEMEERRRVNVDHPDSLETSLLLGHLRALRAGKPVELPVYDFATHTRAGRGRVLEPAPVVLVEGILVLAEARLRRLMDLKVFVHVPADERLTRRLDRDVRLRGRTPDSVRADHETRVQPMHERFVEPSRRWADMVIEGGGRNTDAILALTRTIRRLLG